MSFERYTSKGPYTEKKPKKAKRPKQVNFGEYTAYREPGKLPEVDTSGLYPPENTIARVTNFNELKTCILKYGFVKKHNFEKNISSARILAKKIDNVRTGIRPITDIPEAFGLREKVKELLRDEESSRSSETKSLTHNVGNTDDLTIGETLTPDFVRDNLNQYIPDNTTESQSVPMTTNTEAGSQVSQEHMYVAPTENKIGDMYVAKDVTIDAKSVLSADDSVETLYNTPSVEQSKQEKQEKDDKKKPDVVNVKTNSVPKQNEQKREKRELPIKNEKRTQKKESLKTKEPFFDTRFTETFGITQEALRGIKGFERLSQGQQKLLYENFVQCTLGSVREEVARICTEESNEKRALAQEKYGKVLGGAFSAFQHAFASTYTKISHEKKVAEDMKTQGLVLHEDLLKQLVESLVHHGPRVHENEKGEIEVDLVNIRERSSNGETRADEWFAMTELNKAAHAFAKIPAEWGYATLGVDTVSDSKIKQFFHKTFASKEYTEYTHHTSFTKAQETYESAKNKLEGILRIEGKTDIEIARILLAVDSRVHQLQTIQTNPDALQVLEDIEHSNVLYETAKNICGKAGLGYMALGFVGRTVLGSALGFVGTPMVSAGIASMRSWDKSAAELRERDRNARMGVKDTKEGALNIVSSADLITKTEHLINRFYSAKPDEDLKILAQLRARAEYIHDKQMLGRVDYGVRNTMVSEQLKLHEVLAEAMAVLHTNEHVWSNTSRVQDRYTKSSDRLKAQLAKKEKQTAEMRFRARKKERMKEVVKAAGFSIVGATLSEWWGGGESVYRATQHISEGMPVSTEHIAPHMVDTSLVEEQSSQLEKEMFPYTTSTHPSEGLPFVSEKVPAYELQWEHAPERPPTTFFTEISHTVKHGDTLTKIFKAQLPILQSIPTVQGQETVLANIFKSLTPEELRSVGIRSGNVNMIYAGEPINMEKLSAILAHKPRIGEFLSGDTRAVFDLLKSQA